VPLDLSPPVVAQGMYVLATLASSGSQRALKRLSCAPVIQTIVASVKAATVSDGTKTNVLLTLNSIVAAVGAAKLEMDRNTLRTLAKSCGGGSSSQVATMFAEFEVWAVCALPKSVGCSERPVVCARGACNRVSRTTQRTLSSLNWQP
jgi:hypothetical protein